LAAFEQRSVNEMPKARINPDTIATTLPLQQTSSARMPSSFVGYFKRRSRLSGKPLAQARPAAS
jgi:hypothetical protein